jgi:hypothetical protein
MTMRIRPRLLWEIALCAALIAATPRAGAADQQPDGIWKSRVPSTPIHGEFNDEDPVGLASGAHLKTDCAINLIAEDGKLYCFTTRTSLEFFEGSPQTYLSAARKFFDQNPTPAQ